MRYRSFRTESGLVFSCEDCAYKNLGENDCPCNKCFEWIEDGSGRIPYVSGIKFQHKDKQSEEILVMLVKKHKATISKLYEELIDNHIDFNFFIHKLFETTNQSFAMKKLKLKDNPIIKKKRLR